MVTSSCSLLSDLIQKMSPKTSLIGIVSICFIVKYIQCTFNKQNIMGWAFRFSCIALRIRTRLCLIELYWRADLLIWYIRCIICNQLWLLMFLKGYFFKINLQSCELILKIKAENAQICYTVFFSLDRIPYSRSIGANKWQAHHAKLTYNSGTYEDLLAPVMTT